VENKQTTGKAEGKDPTSKEVVQNAPKEKNENVKNKDRCVIY